MAIDQIKVNNVYSNCKNGLECLTFEELDAVIFSLDKYRKERAGKELSQKRREIETLQKEVRLIEKLVEPTNEGKVI